MADGGFLRRVRIRNYKSIAACDVTLRPLTVLVGRNGSGKSNFLDAVRFISDSLHDSLDHAVRSRGGIREIRRRSRPAVRDIAIELHFMTRERVTVAYQVGIRVKTGGSYFVADEQLTSHQADGSRGHSYHVVKGEVRRSSVEDLPPGIADRLYLVTASGREEFRPAYDALSAMGFYNLNPERIRELQSPDAGELLRRDGSNLASVVGRIGKDRKDLLQRIGEYLQVIVPDIVHFKRVQRGRLETVEFHQATDGQERPWRFDAASMSDGTLRCLGILVAVMQLGTRAEPVSLVGIEEPEAALHPAATGALLDALREAATHTQILVATQSPDLLDRLDPDMEGLLVVQSKRASTDVGPADGASLSAIRRHLYSPGELLRMDQLETDQDGFVFQSELALG